MQGSSSGFNLSRLARRCLAFLALVFVFNAGAVSFQVTTNADGSRTFSFPSNTMGGSTSYYNVPPAGSTQGNSVYTPVTPIANNNNFGGLTWEASPTGGGVVGSGRVNLPVGTAGQTVEIVNTLGISKGVLAGAAARIIGGPLGTAAAMAIPPLLDWLHKNGVDPAPDGSAFQKTSGSGGSCTVAPCYGYLNSDSSTVYGSALEAAQAFKQQRASQYPNWQNCTLESLSDLSWVCSLPGQFSWSSFMLSQTPVAPSSGTPLTPGDIENILNSGTSAPPDVVPGILNQNVELPVSSPVPPTTANPSPSVTQVSGPSSVQVGQPVVTVQSANPVTGDPGSTTTTSQVTSFTYSGNTVQGTTTTTTSVQSNAPIGSPAGTPLPAPVVTTTTRAGMGTAADSNTPSSGSNTGSSLSCGLPGGPACKIDEFGVEKSIAAASMPAPAASEAFDKLDAALAKIGTDVKDTSWGLTPWWLQSRGCSAVKIMDMPAKINMAPLMFDICPILPTIYLLMDFLWITFTFFAAVAMVRSTVGA